MARLNSLRLVWQAQLPDHTIGVAWSTDGKHLAAAAVSGPIAIFESSQGKAVHELKGHGFGTSAIALQPGSAGAPPAPECGRDARAPRLASAGQDGKVRLWNEGTEVAVLEGGSAWVEHVKWNASGTWLAASAGKKVRIWDATGTLIRELPLLAGTVTDLAWRPGTNHLAVLAYAAANIFDPATGELVRTFAWKGSPLAMAWSPDGKVLAHGNQDSTVHFWYTDTGADLQMYGYPTKVRELAWDFTSRYLATGGGPMPCLWDCGGPQGPEGTKPQMLEGHDENLTALAYQARGYLLASASVDGRVLLWQPANKKAPQVGEFQFKGAEATAIAWSPDEKSLAVGSGSGAVAVLRVG